MYRLIFVMYLIIPTFVGASPDDTGRADERLLAQRFADLALACVHQEYPNKISHTMSGDADVKPPRELFPAFYGCFDWHSSVHAHWLLTRLLRLYPDAEFAAATRAALAQSFAAGNIEQEVNYFLADGRAAFERPYGIAWYFQLMAELRGWDNPAAKQWQENLQPLEAVLLERTTDWLGKLAYPIRTGEHSQTAFAFGLMADWAVQSGNVAFFGLLKAKSMDFYADDRACPLNYEPSGQDFLSPCIAEANLTRRFLSREDYAGWLRAFLRGMRTQTGSKWLPLATVTDRSDGKLAHLDGLHLSRAWMLEGMATALDPDNPIRNQLELAASSHRKAGLAAVTGEHYAGGHWLGSFATYLVTNRGIKNDAP